MNKLLFLVATVLGGMAVFHVGTARGDATTDAMYTASNSGSVYRGKLDVDQFNSASVAIETLIFNQETTFRVRGKAMGTAAIRLLGENMAVDPGALGAFSASSATSGASCPTTELAPIYFHNLRIYIDGCDVTDGILNLCNTTGCWATTGTTASSLTGAFEFKTPVVLNDLLPVSCSGAKFGGFVEDGKHNIEFREAFGSDAYWSAGGRVEFEIVIKNKSHAQ